MASPLRRVKGHSSAEIASTAGLCSILLAGEKLLRDVLRAMQEALEDSGGHLSFFPELRFSCPQPPGRNDSGKRLQLGGCRDMCLKSTVKKAL
ncbi:unnamed protein product [Lampetra planeri]